tara:strand:+ start:186 stop:302 length:117 start_codon:yes stop_codon:yes gene_type:complete
MDLKKREGREGELRYEVALSMIQGRLALHVDSELPLLV